MKNILLLLIATGYLFANTVHSSLSTYYENKTFSSSLQKEDGEVYGIGADIHHNSSEYKVTYEHGITNTLQPPLTKDLEMDKLFVKYGYQINSDFAFNLNYILVNDNIVLNHIAPSYGTGISYNINKKLSAGFTQFYTDYEKFNVYQSDLNFHFKTEIDKLKIKLSSLSKYISIDEESENSLTKNAKESYLTTGIKVHSHYKSYHVGGGAYFGKRAFAIMNDGFKTQHHAMEFDRTYVIGVGKTISNIVIRIQYIYQRATELPSSNEDVKVKNLRLVINYKF